MRRRTRPRDARLSSSDPARFYQTRQSGPATAPVPSSPPTIGRRRSRAIPRNGEGRPPTLERVLVTGDGGGGRGMAAPSGHVRDSLAVERRIHLGHLGGLAGLVRERLVGSGGPAERLE